MKREKNNKVKQKLSDEKLKMQMFWRNEYPNWSLEKRKKYWFKKFYRQVYWDGNANKISIFNMNNYIKWKKLDFQMDIILKDVLKRIDDEFGAKGEFFSSIKDKLNLQ